MERVVVQPRSRVRERAVSGVEAPSARLLPEARHGAPGRGFSVAEEGGDRDVSVHGGRVSAEPGPDRRRVPGARVHQDLALSQAQALLQEWPSFDPQVKKKFEFRTHF